MNKSERVAEQLGKVAVLYGGLSSEREISLESGAAVLQALQEEGIQATAIDVGENTVQEILGADVDRVFIALHGEGGEDGRIQALLEFLDLPYTGSGVAASALCMDKLRTKQLWLGVGLPTPEYAVLNDTTNWQKTLEMLGGEAIVKPSHEGSSIGIERCRTADELRTAFEHAHALDSTVIAERYITGAEYTVAILDSQPLPPVRLETDNVFYDFEAKYRSDSTRYICPCGLAILEETRLSELALAAFTAVGATGWGRVDIMADSNGNYYLLEVNTVPGMTSHSLVPMAARAAGYSFNDLVMAIIRQTLV